jgi:K+-sensing histidine kinase KdpD
MGSYIRIMFEVLRRRRDRVAVSCALVIPPAVCAVLIPSRTSLPNTVAALVLVVFIVAVAAFGNRLAGYVAALGAALWFDFFLTVPYERFAITHRADIETTVLLLLVGISVTELAVTARRRGRTVKTDETLLAVVQSTAAMVARGEAADAVTAQVSVQLKALLGARACVFEPVPGRIRGLRFDSDGSLRWGPAVWDLAEHGFPDNENVDLPARHHGEVYGRFILDPVPGTAPDEHARRTAIVLAGLAGSAVAAERMHHGR